MIRIDKVPHSMQRYDTVGDWVFSTQGDLYLIVSHLYDRDYENLVALHEMIEALLCQARGITGDMVDTWDLSHPGHPDPGSIPGCPYYREHMFAICVERLMAAELEVNWDEYETCLEVLCEKAQ